MKPNNWLLGAVLLVGFYNTGLAEDFQPKLEEMGQTDTSRSVPAFSVIKLLNDEASRAQSTPREPLQQNDFRLDMNGFGSVPLGSNYVIGPDDKGKTWTGGMDDKSVRIGWLRDAPDLLLVVWLEVPNPRGNANIFWHSSVILRAAPGSLAVLLRTRDSITRRSQDFTYDSNVRNSYFSYNAKTHALTQKTSRYAELWSTTPHDLYIATADVDEGFRAVIQETFVRKWKYAGGQLALDSVELFYKSQEGVTLEDIARFYLGPWARRRVILDANPDLETKYKDQHPGAYIYPPPGTMIRIPVPEDWLRNVDPL